MSDKYLSRAFAGLREEDRPQTPSFAQTLARAKNKRQDKRPTWSRSMTRIAVPAAFVLLCLVSFLTLSGIDNGPDADLDRLAEKLGTWRAPTSTLVDEPEIFVSTESIATNQASWGTPTDSLFVELAYYQDDGS
jgi:hypothetical protein